MQSLGTRPKYTEQYCMSNIIATHLIKSTVIPCVHIQARESKGTTRIQVAKVLGPGRDRDEANIILAHAATVFESRRFNW